jgi:rifampicin phosphotransferase
VSDQPTPTSAWIGDSRIGERFPAWTRGNAADVFPEPFSLLGQDLVLRQAMSRGLRDAYISFGALDWEEFEEPELPDLFKVFGGYPYNPLSLTRVLGARMPGASPELIDQAFFDEGADIPPYEPQPWHDSAKHAELLAASVGWALSVEEFPFLDADKTLANDVRDSRPGLDELDDAALIARAKAMVPYVQQTFDNAMRVSSLSSVGTGIIGAITTALGDPTMAVRLLAGIEVDSGAPSHAMWEMGRLARRSPAVTSAFDAGVDGLIERLKPVHDPSVTEFLNHLELFFRRFGSRGPNEYDPISVSWELSPRIALAAIDLMRQSDDAAAPRTRQAVAVAERDRLLAQIREQLAGDAETLGTFEAGLRSAQLFLAGRERAKTNCVRIINEMRVALHALGRRWVDRGLIAESKQLFMLRGDELEHLRHDPEQFRAVIAERWATYRRLAELEPVFNANHEVPELSAMTPRAGHGVEPVAPGTVLRGTAGSAGVATGRARVVLDAADPVGLEPGDVLIAPQTDPSWVPLFVPAAAVVVNVGALGSHAMIVSRELGIPCVVAVGDATKKIPDGATVTVDGNTGTVTLHP